MTEGPAAACRQNRMDPMFQTFEITADSTQSADRLRALRSVLADRGVDAFLVPRGDAHSGEMVAPADERLAWLTGFTGSAGMAVVTAERAALFVDGRYPLQAAAQTDPTVLEIQQTPEAKVSDWLKEVLAEDAAVSFDPWLHAPQGIERLETALGRSLVPLEMNPIDAVWADRPPRPAGAVSIHPESLAGESSAAKRRRLGEALAEEEVAAAVLTLPDSIAWLLNIRGSDVVRSPAPQAFALLHADGRVTLCIEEEKLDGAVRDHLGEDVALRAREALLDEVRTLASAGATLRVDRGSCPVAVTAAIEAAGGKPALGADPCIAPKAVKNAVEIEGMRAAHRRDGAAVCRFLAALERDLAAGQSPTEIAVAERIEAARLETEALVDLAFDTISGSGPNGAIVHYRVTVDTDRTVVPGDLLLVDSGGQYRDGTTDITRTLATGPVEPEQARAFTLVLKGMIAISLARWPAGLTGRDLDPLARTALWRAGMDYDHGTGHGVGAFLNVHEGPASLSRRSGDVALETGMILSNEPGYYRTGAFGIRIENLVIVTAPEVPSGGDRPMHGFETLTLAPIDRRLIVAEMLDAAEHAWLDAYHARVAAEIGPLVDAQTGAWLAAACAPL
ncbi:MAG: aminopeptidase P family protein [Pseudomonadota bacterium]